MAYFEFIAKVDSRGRVKIPQEVIDNAEYKSGDVLRVRTRPAGEEF